MCLKTYKFALKVFSISLFGFSMKNIFAKKTGYYKNVFLTQSDYLLRDSSQRKKAKLIGITLSLFGLIVFMLVSVALIKYFWLNN
jgi:uncharacterized membrane protein